MHGTSIPVIWVFSQEQHERKVAKVDRVLSFEGMRIEQHKIPSNQNLTNTVIYLSINYISWNLLLADTLSIMMFMPCEVRGSKKWSLDHFSIWRLPT